MKHHELTHVEWYRIRDQIRAEHGDSMILLRGKMQRELGFLPRDHYEWRDGRYHNCICIDFYTEQARTWFLLKFL